MSFREIALTVRAVNRASAEFNRIQSDAESLATRVKSLGSALAGLGASGVAIGYVANQFGLLSDAEMRVFNSVMSVVTVMGVFLRTSTGLAIAQKVYSAACWVATAAQNALNISYGTFLALTGVGIAVIVAAAAAMWTFANSMNQATASVQNFNTAASETPTHTRSIQRAGESALTSGSRGGGSEAPFYRRGVEQ
jgi:ABC-type multidrug transport system fused ATPase/permease subunit